MSDEKTEKKKTELPELPHTITLSKPIPVKKNGKESTPITEVTIKREATLDDLIAVEGLSPIRQNRKCIVLITDLPEGAVGRLSPQDFHALRRVVFPFFEAGETEDEADSLPLSDAGDE